ncbi:kinase-like domain-containing protein [Rhizophagus clarus]|uniref:Kinase-like domain-containing protein n=1 Tax=Rhizophagus clarus TaxID=94130 RepID=A0A8H3QGE6_9GLOM|nr:kinase-like domain-containing protein [Rhizophagus clarus]
MGEEIPLITVPFPPELTVEEILSRRSNMKLKSRGPNQFFIYRLSYLKELYKRVGENMPNMIKISPDISRSWAREPSEVKEFYKDLAKQVENQLKVMRSNELIIIPENFNYPQQTPTNNNYTVVEPTFFSPYDYDFYYYEFYSYYYFY